MKTFEVKFHAEDQVETMKVQKLSSEDYDQATEGGTRHLFDLNTNIGFFVFFDAEDKDGKEYYLMLQYEDQNEEPTNCYGFELKDFYEFSALYLNDLEFTEELNEEEGELGPVQHLAHLLYHIIEEGKTIEV
ncbi:cytosolic protein [Mesobacillus subterraneus]|uniref:cytosolic protein n=1 Tax=Mesobacillus subterraneus TaxID=285983 RepID=UPI001CFD0F41|nr:cytosolic protein [Mesobacillus subterraneus]WLR57652.1 cytosolic protein [Mesobacillus subterraneus]